MAFQIAMADSLREIDPENPLDLWVLKPETTRMSSKIRSKSQCLNHIKMFLMLVF